jgi:type I restriction enzyme R subunit
VNAALEKRMAARKMLERQLLRLHRHAEEQDAGDVRRAAAARRRGQGQARPFHSYTMKQAVEERFILDVLKATRRWTATTS